MKTFFKKELIIYAILIYFFFTLTSSLVMAKETITWPYICYKPLYICEDDVLVDGIGLHLVNFIQKEMTEYDHDLMLMPVKRILSFAQKGERQIFYGFYKTPERDSFLRFSLPCRISIPTFIVVRKSDLTKFGNGKPIVLKMLLKNEKLRFLRLKSISFGKEIDEILLKHQDTKKTISVTDTTNMGQKSLKMLLGNRIDYYLSLDSTSHDIKYLGVSDQVSYIPIVEQNRYEVGYITAPDNDWGNMMIDKINLILQKLIPEESFFDLFKPLVNKDMVPSLKKEFERLIIQPSRLNSAEQ